VVGFVNRYIGHPDKTGEFGEYAAMSASEKTTGRTRVSDLLSPEAIEQPSDWRRKENSYAS
jgi:hypothetical protein